MFSTCNSYKFCCLLPELLMDRENFYPGKSTVAGLKTTAQPAAAA
jgi:hypothetical protein